VESAAPIRGGPLKRVPSFDAPLHPVAAGTVALAGPIARLPSTKENGYWVYLFKTAATLNAARGRRRGVGVQEEWRNNPVHCEIT
jgi:hypothetical protein